MNLSTAINLSDAMLRAALSFDHMGDQTQAKAVVNEALALLRKSRDDFAQGGKVMKVEKLP